MLALTLLDLPTHLVHVTLELILESHMPPYIMLSDILPAPLLALGLLFLLLGDAVEVVLASPSGPLYGVRPPLLAA